jgi:hypothetical protein
MAFQLTETEQQAPSERLAKNLEYFKERAGESGKLDELEETCVGQSAAHAGHCLASALLHLSHVMVPAALATNAGLLLVKGYLDAALAEVKDASYILDGYHAWNKQNLAWEQEVSEDLDICGYAGKWKSAKEGVAREKPLLLGESYWEAVRTYFLELGGCYLSERTEPAPIDWTAPMPHPIIPALPYAGESMKVRQG